MSVNIKPLADRVLVKRLENEEMSPGGIVIPDSAKEKPAEGEVIAVGPGKKDHEMSVKTSDRILFGKYSGTEVKFNGEDYLIMREEDILAIVS